jgi:enamine deaminase RidA (YjgF/YER057c/UK114 family)
VNPLKTNIAPVIPALAQAEPATAGVAKTDLPQVLQPAGWPAPKGYANGMMAKGRLVVTGGVIGWDVTGNFPDSFIGQVEQALANIVEILAVAGAGPEHLVRLTWYVVDVEEYVEDLKALGQAYRKVVGPHYPAMAVVQVVRLVEKAARVEIEATAVIPD